jgi:hypothetical protein
MFAAPTGNSIGLAVLVQTKVTLHPLYVSPFASIAPKRIPESEEVETIGGLLRR